MKIAFVSGNQEKLPDAVIPLGLLQVMASTPARHEKLLIDLCFEPDPARALRAQIEAFGPDLVALGMRNIQTNEYSGINDKVAYYSELISHMKEATDAPVVIGGGGFSVMPRELMERLRPDFGIAGEGELAFAELVEALEEAPERLADVANLHRFEHGQLVSNPAASGFLDMNRLPLPDRTLLDRRYYEGYGIDSVQTKRGCPLRCDYCTYPLIEGRVARVRDPAAVVDEMFLVLEQQPATQHLFIVDSVFNLPTAYAKNVCREMIARAWKLPWTCYANPLGFDRELAELAREAGCAGMEIGSDSGCNEILESLRKGFTTDQIRSLHQLCESAGVPDCHTFILGTRGETLEHVRRTLDFIVELDPFSAIIMIWVDDYEALDPELRKQRIELRSQIEKILMKRKRDFPQWVIPALGVNFSEALFRLLRRNGLRGPLWQHIRAGR
ncbi:MAG: radical SAM protein [Deltaproteobacteria bacterium]|nr:radical SAM protein [Deltaproteobacteria bacterium]